MIIYRCLQKIIKSPNLRFKYRDNPASEKKLLQRVEDKVKVLLTKEFEIKFPLGFKLYSPLGGGEFEFKFKINVSYMQAHDWEADNMAAVDGTTSADNPGGYDAVNRYGDEDIGGDYNNLTSFQALYLDVPGLKKYHRTGYLEKDIVDVNILFVESKHSK